MRLAGINRARKLRGAFSNKGKFQDPCFLFLREQYGFVWGPLLVGGERKGVEKEGRGFGVVGSEDWLGVWDWGFGG